MTHQKEAKALFDRFYAISGNHPGAKKSALICVDEIYNWLEDGKAEEGYLKLEKVKQEIKLI